MKFYTAQFRNLILAATLAMVVEFLMSLTDRVVAGNLLGEPALAGLGLCTAADQLAVFFSLLVACGASIRFLSAMGRFDAAAARRAFSCGLFAAIGLGVLVSGLLTVARDPFLGLFGADPETLGHAVSYWRWFMAAILVMPLQIYLLVMVYADGDETACMISYPVQLGVNAVVSWLGCRAYGTAGCAFGTFCGNLASVAVLSGHFLKRANALRPVAWFSFRELGLMAKGAFADAAVQLCWAVMTIVVCRVTAAADPALMPVAATVGTMLGFTVVFDGVSTAAQPLLEVYYGEGNFRRVRSLMKLATTAVVIEGLVVSLVEVAAPQVVLELVGIEDGPSRAAAAEAVRTVGLAMVFWALAALYNSYYQYIERPLLACALVAVKELVVPAVFVLAGFRLGGFRGIWIGYALAAPVSLVLFATGVRILRGRHAVPLLLPAGADERMYVWDAVADASGASAVSRAIAEILRKEGGRCESARMAPLIVEETLMLVNERNRDRRVRAEVLLDLRSRPTLIIRDDGEIFDLTDADQRVESFRTYLVAELMYSQKDRRNLTTTGFNRNRFVF